jgi:flagellar protein FliJ
MDTRDSTALRAVLDRESERRDMAARALREAEQRLQQLLSQTESLREYRGLTSKRWSAHAGQHTSVQQLHTAGGFMLRLDEALQHQGQAEQRAQGIAAQRRAELLAAEQRVAAVEKLLRRRHHARLQQQDRREQRASDEAAQLRHVHAAAADARVTDHGFLEGV